MPLFLLCALLLAACSVSAASLKVAPFTADATPDAGEPNIWVQPVTSVMDPLYVKGIVLDDGRFRYVIAAIDWCGIGGSIDLKLRTALAQAASTDVTRVALQSVHQHAAPYVDGDGYAWMTRHQMPRMLFMSDAYLDRLAAKMQAAVKSARFQSFDQVGTSMAKVDRVAGMRRLLINGKIATRYSSTARDPALAAEPEGAIDPFLRTVTFARGSKPIVRLHYYASHPQTFCCDGRVSADFPGAARARLEKESGLTEIYFNGGGGDVTVGKYNTGKDEERAALADRLYAAMKASAAAVKYRKASSIEWRYEPLELPKFTDPPKVDPAQTHQIIYRDAMVHAFSERTRPLPSSALHIAGAVILHIPGEPMLEFQKFAQAHGRDRFVAFAGYGDISPGYLCTDEAFRQGGYEPSASRGAPGTEARVKEVIQKLLRE